jgi:hypothetical protein
MLMDAARVERDVLGRVVLDRSMESWKESWERKGTGGMGGGWRCDSDQSPWSGRRSAKLNPVAMIWDWTHSSGQYERYRLIDVSQIQGSKKTRRKSGDGEASRANRGECAGLVAMWHSQTDQISAVFRHDSAWVRGSELDVVVNVDSDE